jgi:dihydroorotate dehydrogenase (fumarate)
MSNITTKYLGLTLRSPIVVGSCGLTASPARVQELERNGAGAVVLKSIFEEDIAFEYQEVLQQASPGAYNLEAFDYYDQQVKGERLSEYIKLIQDCKRKVSIPVIASVNCAYSHEWSVFAQRLQAAGADALELNMFFPPSDLKRTSAERKQLYFDIVEKVLGRVSIPVALKISHYMDDLGAMIQRLSQSGVSALVLFNRFYSPDFKIDGGPDAPPKVVQTNVLSTPDEFALPLRWVALMAGRVGCDLVASTGIHDGSAVIKQILAGAQAVQVVSALYRNGTDHLQTMTQELQDWMIQNECYELDQFRGSMSQAKAQDPAVYERFQFMKHFGGLA